MDADRILTEATRLSHEHAERAIIGLLLGSPEEFLRVRALICDPFEFAIKKHQLIYQAMLDCVERGGSTAFLSVRSRLHDRKQLESVGSSYLLDCQLASCLPYALEETCEIIRDAADKRRMLMDHLEIANDIKEGRSAKEIAERISATAKSVRNRRTKKKETSLRELIVNARNALVIRRDNPDAAGLVTGFDELDALIGGIGPGAFVILGGRPSMGKSSFAINIAHNAIKRGKRILFFSLEMSQEQVINRMMSREARVDGTLIKTGKVTDANLDAWDAAFHRFTETYKGSVDVFDATCQILTVEDIAAHVESFDEKPDAIIVDYIQIMLVPPSKRRRNSGEYEDVSALSSGLNNFAKSTGIPVFGLSQLSRDVEKRANKRPGMADLKSSGSLEQDADYIGLLYREKYYKKTAPTDDIEVLLVKNRYGETGEARLGFNAKYQDFYNLAP